MWSFPERERCPACDEPITPTQWYVCVAIDRAGTRAHLGCLEAPGLPMRLDCCYLLARRTCSPALLRPGAVFALLVEDYVLIEVPDAEADRQQQLLRNAGRGDGRIYRDHRAALRVARGEEAQAARSAWQEAVAEADTATQALSAAAQAQAAAIASLVPTLPAPPLGSLLTPIPPQNVRCLRNTWIPGGGHTELEIDWDPSSTAPGRIIREYRIEAHWGGGARRQIVYRPACFWVPPHTDIVLFLTATDDHGDVSPPSAALRVRSAGP